MNMIMLLPFALVLCAYFWSGSPQVLKKNKELLLGILFGYSICYFMDNKLVEGIDCSTDEDCTKGDICLFHSTGDSPPSTGECGNAHMNSCGSNQPCGDSEICKKSTSTRMYYNYWYCSDDTGH